MKTNINQSYKALSIVLALVLTLAPFAQLHAAPPQPENVTISGDETKPTVSWDSVESEANGVDWTEETGNAGWPERRRHTSEVFDNKLWIMGGIDNATRFNDVWYSEDGVDWTESTSNASWSGRDNPTSAVFDGKLWVLGGLDNSGDCNGSGVSRCRDVWYSEDGSNWTEATNSAAWSARDDHTSLVFDNKLWVLGGRDNTGTLNDVWYSEDGANWTEATGSAPWATRAGYTAAVLNNKMWIMGGASSNNRVNDVWYSEDGANWTEATSAADWSTRNQHVSAAFDNQLWILGGHDGATPLNDTWHYSDGANWTKAVDSAGWSERYSATSAVLDNKLWIMGGRDTDGNRLNDVWSTPNNSISHYKVCWDKTEGECGNSAKVDPDGEVISLNSSNPSWLTKIKDTLIPEAHAQSGELSYTLEDELDSGTWYFSVTAVTMAGDESTSPGTATHTIAGLPDTGYGTQDSNYMNYVLFTVVGIGVLTGGYYLVRRKIKVQGQDL